MLVPHGPSPASAVCARSGARVISAPPRSSWSKTQPARATSPNHRAPNRATDNLKAGLATVEGVTGFLPVVAPASALPNAKNEHYRDEEAFLFGLAEALATEYHAIIDAGLDLQVDDAFIPYQYEKMVPPMTLADYRNWASLHIPRARTSAGWGGSFVYHIYRYYCGARVRSNGGGSGGSGPVNDRIPAQVAQS